jgi:hypothetical protein
MHRGHNFQLSSVMNNQGTKRQQLNPFFMLWQDLHLLILVWQAFYAVIGCMAPPGGDTTGTIWFGTFSAQLLPLCDFFWMVFEIAVLINLH